MAKSPNFANREVANLFLLDYTSGKIELFVDWANVTSQSFEAERVFAKGGQGAPNRVAFDGERTGTLTIEAQVYPAKLFQLMSGNDAGTTAKVIKREILTAASDGITLTESPAGEVAQVFAFDDDYGTELEVEVADTKITGVGLTEGDKFIVYYYANVADATVIKFDATHFPKDLRVEGEAPFKNEAGITLQSRHIWYKVAPQSGFELSWQNTGDPASITITCDIMADSNGNIYDMIFPNAV